MIITSHQKRVCLERKNLDLYLGKEKITQTECEKLLGVYINENLSWDPHIDKLCEKLSNKLLLLKRLKIYMDIPTRVLFYNAYIYSSLVYCCTVWGLHSSNKLNRLFRIQKRAARIIFDNPYDYLHRELFTKLEWLEISNLIHYRSAISS